MKKIILMFLCVGAFAGGGAPFAGAEPGKQPITVNGDSVEFLSNGREVVADGNVEIFYEESVLRCDKVRVFIDEKLVIAEGNVYFAKGGSQEMRGEMIIYDFGAGSGTIVGPDVALAPYFGKADLMEKVSDTEILMSQVTLSTCDLPHPHFCLHCSEVRMNPGQTMSAKNVAMTVGDVPILYLPYYAQEMSDNKPKWMIIPGYKKNFGAELFGSYRYNLTENLKGVLHGDWYQNKGFAEGVDLKYDTKIAGAGNVKYYHIDQKSTDDTLDDILKEDDGHRSRVEVRHRWDISPSDQAVLDFFRTSDANFRKDYFSKEYEKSTNPASFFLYSHAYPNATLSLLSQPRVNRFDSVLQKLPELKLETTNQKIIGTPVYYKDLTTASSLSQTTANSGSRSDVGRVDTLNQLSLPFKLWFLDVNPFVGNRDTFYSRGINADTSYLRTMFISGVDFSTRFYKILNVNTNALGLDINHLRHIVTPSVQYLYQRTPSVNKNRFFQLDGIDTLDFSDAAVFSLENKLQTKRNEETVDLARLIFTTQYDAESNSTTSLGFHYFKYDLELKPYSWMNFDSDGDFDLDRKMFKSLNTDLWGKMGILSVVAGYRFQHSASSQVTTGLSCPLNPFWTAAIYERFECRTGSLVEHEYRLTRDMHCWVMELIVNQKEGGGVACLLGFKLKAFPGINVEAQTTVATPPRTA